jgi:chromate reductase, NAD(P)H dehydrogenase (quinone)
MAHNINIIGFSGSIRKNSNNTGLLRAAQELLPEGVTLQIYDLSDIPLYNEDLFPNLPQAVIDFKAAISAADALLIATPEYNYSFTGVLKNALDWASRPMNTSAFPGKPAAILGAGGMMGTSRAQYQLRQVLSALNVLTLNKPEVLIQRAWEKFDEHGNLTDAAAREQVKALLEALKNWTLRLNPEPVSKEAELVAA